MNNILASRVHWFTLSHVFVSDSVLSLSLFLSVIKKIIISGFTNWPYVLWSLWFAYVIWGKVPGTKYWKKITKCSSEVMVMIFHISQIC